MFLQISESQSTGVIAHTSCTPKEKEHDSYGSLTKEAGAWNQMYLHMDTI